MKSRYFLNVDIELSMRSDQASVLIIKYLLLLERKRIELEISARNVHLEEVNSDSVVPIMILNSMLLIMELE